MKASGRSYNRRMKMLRSYIVALAVLSLSFLLMPLVNRLKEGTRIPMYAVGALFWISLIATVRASVRINRSRRKSVVFHRIYQEKKKLGLTHFFQNKEAKIMDIMMFISTGIFVVSCVLDWNIIVQFVLVSMLVFSFGMHCMLNGTNYIYIKRQAKVRRE